LKKIEKQRNDAHGASLKMQRFSEEDAMIISVRDDDGTEAYLYDTDKKALCLHPSQDEVPEVVAALEEAIRFLGDARSLGISLNPRMASGEDGEAD
jgi:hypothetical protein